jgi:parallel beta-helix repeat protein
MSGKLVLTTILIILFAGMFCLQFAVQRVEASGTIYIEPDGSIYPAGSPISTLDNVTYWLTLNASYSIVILRDNTVFNGSGYRILGPGSGYGITATQRTNVTITNVEVMNFDYGIWLYESSNCSVTGNNVAENNWEGITLYYSDRNLVSGNIATEDIDSAGIWVAHSAFNTVSLNQISHNHDEGLYVDHESHDNLFYGNNITSNSGLPWTYGIYIAPYSYNNTFIGNTITNNPVGIYINFSPNNTIFHNNFIVNTLHARLVEGNTPNIWDNGNEGNCWDNYTAPDSNHDGIGDSPYVIDTNNTDHYPLMGTFSEFPVSLPSGSTEKVAAVSNSIISNLTLPTWLSSPYNGLQPGQPFIRFFATGQNGSVGFCRLMFPRTIFNSSSYIAMIDGVPTNATQLTISNSTHVYLYLTYAHTTHEVIITISEFPSIPILILIMIATLLTAIVCRRHSK